MTDLLQKAFEEVSKLSISEQDDLASWILEELASERRWTRSFANSKNALSQLAEEALSEHRKGKTEVLVPDNL